MQTGKTKITSSAQRLDWVRVGDMTFANVKIDLPVEFAPAQNSLALLIEKPLQIPAIASELPARLLLNFSALSRQFPLHLLIAQEKYFL